VRGVCDLSCTKYSLRNLGGFWTQDESRLDGVSLSFDFESLG